MRAGNGGTDMSAVKNGEGLAAIEDVTVARLGIWLERHDTSAGIGENGD